MTSAEMSIIADHRNFAGYPRAAFGGAHGVRPERYTKRLSESGVRRRGGNATGELCETLAPRRLTMRYFPELTVDRQLFVNRLFYIN